MTISGWNGKATRKTFVAALGTIMVMSAVLMSASVVLAASAAVNLDQCRNGGLVAPPATQTFIECSGGGSGNSGWVNGNAGASNAHYAEGESISYRARLTNLKANDQVVLILGYDVIHSGVHAIDYLTDKNRWQGPETTVGATPDKPCSGVTGCVDPTDLLTAPIPAPLTNVHADPSKTRANGCETTNGSGPLQPSTSFATVAAAGEAKMEFFDAVPATSNAIQYVAPAPNLLATNGDQEQQVSVTFTATSASPVLAWGGHIARRADWGCSDQAMSASGISGSPYHMRIKDMTVNGTHVNLGNQDRSLSAAAVIVSTPTLPTTPSAGGPIGTVLNDTATITGGNNPSGTVLFNLYGPNDNTCAGAVIYTQTVAVSGGAATTSPGFTTLAAGTYQWTAHYSGDNSNLPADSACGDEAVVIAKASPTLPTTPSAGGGIGTILNDTATVTGGSNPTGSVTFNLYGPGDLLCANAAIYTQTVALTAGSATTTPGFTTVAAGTYEWTAHYGGDANNNTADSACGDEAVVIAKASPTLPTTPSAGGGIGTILNDTATVTGGSNPTGSVTFNLYGPGDLLCANAAIYTQTVALTAGSATTTPGFTTVAAGTYEWTAHYGGDANNNTADSACGDEAVVIGKSSPTNTTNQDLIPNDNFVLSNGTSPTGSITFKLFAPSDATCSGAPALTQTVTVNGNGTYSTTNSTFHATTEGTWRWLSVYGGDSNNFSSTSACGVERFTIANS